MKPYTPSQGLKLFCGGKIKEEILDPGFWIRVYSSHFTSSLTLLLKEKGTAPSP
jgi:hypothetical protein